jgi:hypothetical protein
VASLWGSTTRDDTTWELVVTAEVADRGEGTLQTTVRIAVGIPSAVEVSA